jgi:hypothetical protein
MKTFKTCLSLAVLLALAGTSIGRGEFYSRKPPPPPYQTFTVPVTLPLPYHPLDKASPRPTFSPYWIELI